MCLRIGHGGIRGGGDQLDWLGRTRVAESWKDVDCHVSSAFAPSLTEAVHLVALFFKRAGKVLRSDVESLLTRKDVG